MIKAGIFDVGGVLHTNEMQYIREDIYKSLQITSEEYVAAQEDSLDKFQKGKIDENTYWKEIIAKTHAKGVLPSESLYGREFKKRYKVHKDILELIKKLKENGYVLAVLSNTISPHLDFQKELGIYDLFDIKVFSNEVGMVKPNKDIYEYTLKKLHLHPDEVFFTDDIQENVDTANELGIHGILFQNKENFTSQLKQLGVRI